MKSSIANPDIKQNKFSPEKRRKWQWLQKPLSATLDFILPPTCLLCHSVTHTRSGEPAMCARCWGALTPLSPQDANVEAMLEEASFSGFKAPFLYNEAAGGLVQKLKYNDGLHLARFMAGQMAPLVTEAGVDVIVPVPLHKKRLHQRKYNQSAEIARQLSYLTGVLLKLNDLTRLRRTSPQVGQPAKVRRKQLADAFYAPEGSFKGEKVLIVDDVCTTGSTAHWCAEGLKNAGAEDVQLLTFAYVEPKLY